MLKNAASNLSGSSIQQPSAVELVFFFDLVGSMCAFAFQRLAGAVLCTSRPWYNKSQKASVFLEPGNRADMAMMASFGLLGLEDVDDDMPSEGFGDALRVVGIMVDKEVCLKAAYTS